MVANNINLKEVTRDMSPAKQKETSEKCRAASEKYSEIAALLDEAGVAMENNNFDECIAKLEKAKSSIE